MVNERKQVQEGSGGQAVETVNVAALLQTAEWLEGWQWEFEGGCALAMPLPEELKKRRRRKRIKSSDQERINSAQKPVPALNPVTVSNC